MERNIFGEVVAVLSAAGLGWLIGFFAGLATGPTSGDLVAQVVEYPLPHHVPEFRGGVTLRFAMVHDVLLERFPKHGDAYYRERNRLTQRHLDELPESSTDEDPSVRFALTDDLAVGLDRLGKSAEAVALLRSKLDRQRAAGLKGGDLYTTYANLGTSYIHGSFSEAIVGDEAALERFREGVELIRESIAVNPEAHFGRERWQASIAEFLLAAVDDPSLLGRYDCLGNRLDLEVDAIVQQAGEPEGRQYGRPATLGFRKGGVLLFQPVQVMAKLDLNDPMNWSDLSSIRRFITKVGAENGWDAVPVPANREPVPFDEPTLGIIGMWRQGGGANPHFALALGETMLRVGQRYIAWEAFERAARLADRFWPDPAIRRIFLDHCHARQAAIVANLRATNPWELKNSQHQSLPPPTLPTDEIINVLGSSFGHELAAALAYREAAQAFEAAQIEAGTPLAQIHYDGPFGPGAGPLATPVGPEERFGWLPPGVGFDLKSRRGIAWGAFGAGAAVLLLAIGSRWYRGRDKLVALDRA